MHKILQEILETTRQRAAGMERRECRVENSRSLWDAIGKARRRHLVPVLAEVKPASPTTSFRNVSPPEAGKIAAEMERAGACGVSVLTEPAYFQGSIENLKAVRSRVSIPVLRKDFIIQEAQVTEVEADLVLLIAGILQEELKRFIKAVQDIGAEPLVEVHTRDEAEAALSTDARIIGVNNRDLHAFNIDLSTTTHLAPLIRRQRPDAIIISESGVSAPEDAVAMLQSGADAVLVGSAIMKGDIYQNTYKLVHAGEIDD